MKGTLTATVEFAGPFQVERKPLSIHVEPTTFGIRYAQIWMPALGILLLLVIVVVLAAQKKTQQASELNY
ncbi:MAG: hypothetical protein GWO38_06890 [Phycisphaerae bacterium]|nr:hypothetical protein [Phycisphaerae bacterium]NIX27356.1 hypothetical protein [Phycisphaerae bacterium]